jgi:glycosyltransferase involved in cell wall biosynthesis
MISKRSPKVSIGIPLFNAEMYISETLESLLNQTYVNFEGLISDNGSTDQTQEICRQYELKDKRIRYHRNENNLGAAANYNLVFRETNGEYFKWMAYDDPIAPDFLERCIAVLDSQPDVSICYTKALILDENGKAVEKYSHDLHMHSSIPHERFRMIIANPGLCNPIFGLIRREVLKHTSLIGDYPHSDRKLLAEISLYGELYEIPDYLFYRRLHALVSTKVHHTERDLAFWYNPDSRNRLILPVWKRYKEYLAAILRAPITKSNKIFCLLHLIQLSIERKRWNSLSTDLILAVKNTTTSLKK